MPDPHSTVLAALRVQAGSVTYDRREDLAATLAPVADDVLARRADLLTAQQDSAQQYTGDELFHLVEAAVDRAASGFMPDTDADVVQMAVALADVRVRDAFLDISDIGRKAAAEQLWAHLVRGLPGPDRAEPASMLAFSAYARGDGVLAAIALECAQAAAPDHRLTGLLTRALSLGIGHDRIRRAGELAAAMARAQLSDT